MDIKQFWQTMRKRWIWGVSVPAIVLMGAGAMTALTPPSYQATTKILLEQAGPSLATLSQPTEQGEFTSISRAGNPLETQIELLKSGLILQKVIRRARLENPKTGEPLTPEAFLTRGKVINFKGTDILQLNFEARDPETAQRVVESWAQVFVSENQANNQKQAVKTATFIEGQLAKTKAELDRAESALRDYKRAHGAIDLSEEARASVQTLTSLESELRQATAAHREASSRVAALRRQVGLSSSQALAAAAVSQDPTFQRLRQQLLDAETNRNSLALGPEHPEVRQLNAQIQLLQDKLRHQGRSLIGRGYSQKHLQANMDPMRQGLARELLQAETDALALQTRVDSLRTVSSRFNQQLTHLPDKELNLTRLTRNAAVTAQTYRLLLQKHQEAKIQAAMSVSNVRVIQAAGLPESPIRPRPLQNMIAALLIGAMLGVGIVLFLEYLDDTIQTVEAAELAVQLPTLGIIPWLRNQSAAMIAFRHPRAPVSEAYRTLRTNIKFLSIDTLRAFAVTSAGPGEGKSTAVSNLAITFAQANKRVLLVDADMRRPSLQTVFDLTNRRGLSSFLEGDVPLAELIQPGPIDNLSVLTSGPTPLDPAELLESDRLDALLQEARSRYDLVIFDAPPIIPVTDASILASRLDGLLLVLGINRVSNKAARHALSLMKAAKVKTWGTVVYGMRPENDSYYDSYYHRYYGNNGQPSRSSA